ncbi:MAG: NUDIX hydrolase [Gammaproteobacteria bacterium]|nr:NUDIX hydrolase [Gammaproteobacteria bacterium]
MPKFTSKPVTPLLTTDLIIQIDESIVLIERRNPPHGWALPGGFVDVGESVEQAARREAKEETGLDVTLECLLGVYSDPKRDSRFHTVSAVYAATADGEPKAGDDAVHIALFSLQELPDLAFDHAMILADYRHYLASGSLPGPN